jgi:hypothetical protein
MAIRRGWAVAFGIGLAVLSGASDADAVIRVVSTTNQFSAAL